MNYPEHEKLAKIQDKSQEIGSFIEWLQGEKELEICKMDEDNMRWPARIPIPDLLAEYFNIDQKKLEKEKLSMLERLRK